ncbi:MAG: ABC transporter, partial [Propionibacteriaceae bacterium]|nr:ABC transporter [Propionibacteriaceae bacterium]
VTVLGVSAATGEGIATFRKTLAKHVADKLAAARRLAADVSAAATRLAEESGTAKAASLSKASVDRMNETLAAAAGATVVTDAVGQAWRLRGGLATGWPVLSWVAKFKPDPLRRLHLDRLRGGGKPKEIDPSRVGRTSLPSTTGVQKARVDTALRALAADAGQGMSRGWANAIKEAARSQELLLADALDRAVATTDLDLHRHHGWWNVVRVLQWLLVAAVVAGLLWLGSAFVLVYLQLPPLPKVTWWGFPAPTVLTVGGVLAGLLLAGLSRIGVEVGARRRALKAKASLRAAIENVTSTMVMAPLNAERDRYENARAAIERARG